MNDATERIEEARPRRFRRYPAYKDSGIKWLGEIPAHWEVKRLKFLLQEALQYGANEPAELMDPDLPRYIRITDVGEDGRLREETFRSIPKDVARPYLLQDGDLLFARSGATVGKTFRFEPSWGRAAYAGYLIRARLKLQRCSSRFVQYFTKSKSYWDWLQTNFIQATIQNVSAERYANLGIALPELREQQEIVSLLDRETARIDGLVARKERLIQLLQEKRAALITRAVTRGLDPNAPMKDSGVEWLGEIPAHWRVVPFKRAINYVEGPGIMAADFLDEGVPLLRISGIGGRWATLEGCNYLSPEVVMRRWSHFQVRSGDLLISGSASMGFCTEVDEGTAGAIPYTGIIIIRPRAERVSKNFVRWMLLSDVFSTQVDLARSGSTIQHYGPSHLARMQVVVPPLDDQCTIAAFLDRETTSIDALIANIRQAIDHLKEFRTAFISAAVTGKIDVREAAS